MIDINRFPNGWQIRTSDFGTCELSYLSVEDGWTQAMVDEVVRVAEEYAADEYDAGEDVHHDLVEMLSNYVFENGEKYDLTDVDDIHRLYDLAYPKKVL